MRSMTPKRFTHLFTRSSWLVVTVLSSCRGGGSGDGDGVTLTWEDSGFSCDQQKGLLAGLQARRTPRAGLTDEAIRFHSGCKTSKHSPVK